jgi:hypothetical protein
MAKKSDAGITAETYSFMQIFGTEFIYRVPVFQRPYVWPKRNVKRLFEDISDITDENESHFIGSMFVSLKARATHTSPGEFWIIDGQQRTTTIYLMLLTLFLELQSAAKSAKSRKEADREKELERLCASVKRRLFYSPDSGGLVPKLFSSLKDSHQMRQILVSTGLKDILLPPDKGIKEDSNLADSHRVLKKCIRDEIAPDGEVSVEKADAFVAKLLDSTKIVFITITDKEDAGVVFNTLNSTAEPLATIDLVRNDIFGRIDDDSQFTNAESLYESRWHPLERRFPSQKEFNDFLFPYVLLYLPQRAKKRLLMPTLKEIWGSVLGDGRDEREWTPDEIIDDLERYAPLYLAFNSSCALAEAKALAATLSPSAALAMWRIRRMGCPVPIYPYLFRLFDKVIRDEGVTDAQLFECVEVIESLVVRRFFSGIEPTGLHAIFKDLWSKVGADGKKLAEHLWPVANCPSDSAFSYEISNRPIYNSVSDIPLYVMLEFERSLSSKGDPIDGLLEQDGRSAITIDHVMPQAASPAWRAEVPEFDNIIDTWGNLVPMTLSANAQKGASDWAVARKLITDGSRFHSTRKVAANQAWGAAEIKARAQELTVWALQRWPHGPKR